MKTREREGRGEEERESQDIQNFVFFSYKTNFSGGCGSRVERGKEALF